MRITSKGQITIPSTIRETLGITSETEIDFVEENGKFYLVKTDAPKMTRTFRKLRGIATTNMTTEEIMNLTRESS